MTFTIENLMDSIAGVLKAGYPDYPVYLGPNQQGTSVPCFFVFLMPSTIEDQVDGRFFRDLGIDIVFLKQRNVTMGNAQLYEIQEYLDVNLEDFVYSDGETTARLHTYEREASREDQELHYKFHIRQRVSLPRAFNPVREMEENHVGIKEIP